MFLRPSARRRLVGSLLCSRTVAAVLVGLMLAMAHAEVAPLYSGTLPTAMGSEPWGVGVRLEAGRPQYLVALGTGGMTAYAFEEGRFVPRVILLPHGASDTVTAFVFGDVDGDGADEVIAYDTTMVRKLECRDTGLVLVATDTIGTLRRAGRELAQLLVGDVTGDGSEELFVVDFPRTANSESTYRCEGTELGVFGWRDSNIEPLWRDHGRLGLDWFHDYATGVMDVFNTGRKELIVERRLGDDVSASAYLEVAWDDGALVARDSFIIFNSQVIRESLNAPGDGAVVSVIQALSDSGPTELVVTVLTDPDVTRQGRVLQFHGDSLVKALTLWTDEDDRWRLEHFSVQSTIDIDGRGSGVLRTQPTRSGAARFEFYRPR